MAITYLASTQATDTATNTFALSVPAGVAANDLLIAQVVTYQTAALTYFANAIGATGFTRYVTVTDSVPTGRLGMSLHYKVVGTAAEPTAYTFTTTAAASTYLGSFIGSMTLWRGEATGAPVVQWIGRKQHGGTGAVILPDSALLYDTNVHFVSFFAANRSATWTPPVGFTERIDYSVTGLTTLGGTLTVADLDSTAATSTGARTATASATGDAQVGAMLVLRQAANNQTAVSFTVISGTSSATDLYTFNGFVVEDPCHSTFLYAVLGTTDAAYNETLSLYKINRSTQAVVTSLTGLDSYSHHDLALDLDDDAVQSLYYTHYDSGDVRVYKAHVSDFSTVATSALLPVIALPYLRVGKPGSWSAPYVFATTDENGNGGTLYVFNRSTLATVATIPAASFFTAAELAAGSAYLTQMDTDQNGDLWLVGGAGTTASYLWRVQSTAFTLTKRDLSATLTPCNEGNGGGELQLSYEQDTNTFLIANGNGYAMSLIGLGLSATAASKVVRWNATTSAAVATYTAPQGLGAGIASAFRNHAKGPTGARVIWVGLTMSATPNLEEELPFTALAKLNISDLSLAAFVPVPAGYIAASAPCLDSDAHPSGVWVVLTETVEQQHPLVLRLARLVDGTDLTSPAEYVCLGTAGTGVDPAPLPITEVISVGGGPPGSGGTDDQSDCGPPMANVVTALALDVLVAERIAQACGIGLEGEF